jgi:hypothetical protein
MNIKRVGVVVGVVLILLGVGLLLQGLHLLPGAAPFHGRWAGLGWGAWALAFGVGFLVWSNGTPSKT